MKKVLAQWLKKRRAMFMNTIIQFDIYEVIYKR